MAYECIRLAEDATDVLKSELGAACSGYGTEDEYLKDILEKMQQIQGDPREYLDWWKLLEQSNIIVFARKIKALKTHIEKTIATPLKNRGKPE